MRRLILHTLFLAAAPLLAQSTTSSVVLVTPPGGQNCPVGLTARYSAQGTVKETGKAPSHSNLGYTVTFLPGHSLKQAKLTLHGLDGVTFMPANDHSTSNASEDLTVAPSAIGNGQFESVVYAEKLTGVRWIELTDITYADGTRWQKSDKSTCVVVPSGLRLVASKH